MISRFENKNFFAAHYDWVAAGVGLLALVAGGLVFALSLGADPEAGAADEVARVDGLKPKETGVKPVDMTTYLLAFKSAQSPVAIPDVGEKSASFLASERRVFCTKCKKAISGDVKAVPKCPYCGEKQKEEQLIVIDSDGDGMPDEWETGFGFKPGDPSDATADADGDGFTNFEEYKAKTDPKDPKSHPDYLDSLAVVLPLKETKLPFYFRDAIKTPGGWKCTFVDPVKLNDYGKRGLRMTAFVGKEIASDDGKEKPGFDLKSYTPKTEKRSMNIKGMEGMKKDVDVSEAVVVRKTDGKTITLTVQQGKKFKLEPVDVQATLAYTRGTVKNIDVVPGSEIDLNGTKYRIAEIKAVGKGAKVTVEDASGKKRVIEALAPDEK
ncbi:MAG: hypothetical protein IKE55_12220 [Kiritimatiellae bacterium]|nr:hypothetical protein [Kiritimatiellia bacterium]